MNQVHQGTRPVPFAEHVLRLFWILQRRDVDPNTPGHSDLIGQQDEYLMLAGCGFGILVQAEGLDVRFQERYDLARSRQLMFDVAALIDDFLDRSQSALWIGKGKQNHMLKYTRNGSISTAKFRRDSPALWCLVTHKYM